MMVGALQCGGQEITSGIAYPSVLKLYHDVMFWTACSET